MIPNFAFLIPPLNTQQERRAKMVLHYLIGEQCSQFSTLEKYIMNLHCYATQTQRICSGIHKKLSI